MLTCLVIRLQKDVEKTNFIHFEGAKNSLTLLQVVSN